MTKIIYKSKPRDFLNKTNHSGFPACERSDREKYIQTLLCNNFGRTYYADENDMTKIAAEMHQKMIREDPEFAAKAIVYARNKGFMRSQPIYGLAVLADKDPVLFEKIFDKVVQIPGDLKDFIGVLSGPANNFGLSKGEGGRVVKRCAAGYLNEMSEYHALKYGGGSGAYDLADIIRTIHPKPKNDLQSKLFKYIVKGDDEKIKIDKDELNTLNKARASMGLDTIDWVAVGMDLSDLPQV
jgi:60 kDa SS-A/Ro ribonucleoprotein